MSQEAGNYRGVIAMIGSCACFSANDAATKVAALNIASTEVVTLRAAITLVIAFLIVLWRSEGLLLRHFADPVLVLRSIIETMVGVIIIYCLALMPLANVIAIVLVQPFLLTMYGALVLKEPVGWRRWGAVSAGFVGMLLVMKPATDSFDEISLLVLLAALLASTRDLLTRKVRTEIPSMVVTFSTALVSVPIGALGALVEPWTIPDPVSAIAIFVSAVFLVFAFTLMVIAFRSAQVSAVSPFRYTIIVFAVIFGYYLFDEIPDAVSLTGIAVIVLAGIYMLHRETLARRQQRTAEQ